MAASNGAISPSELATKSNQRYAAVGTLGVFLWDIILHLPQDYELARRHRINLLFINYWITRLASLAYVFSIVIFTTGAVDDCRYGHQISILYPFTIPLTILPFVVRVSALYDNNRYVVAVISMTWFSVLGSAIAVPIGSFGARVATTEYCSHKLTWLTYVFASVCPLIHETLIFMATSWGFMRNSHSDINMKNGIDVMVLGRNLPAFSKSMLRDGQTYYLIILLLHLFFVVLSFTLRTNMAPCTIVVVMASNMSSYVYRNMRLGIYHDYTITSSEINRALQRPDHSPQA